MLLAALLAPLAHAEAYALADAGITLDLPAGWEMTRWSDWDFKGKTGDGTVAIEVWSTSYQVPVDKDAAEVWAGVYGEKLGEMRATNIIRDTVVVDSFANRPTARTTMRFALEKGGPKGAMFVAAFAVEGKVMHVATLAVGPNVARASAALDTLLNRLTVQKMPASLEALGGPIESELGFKLQPAPGWRAPLPVEDTEAITAVGDIGIGPADPTKCTRVFHPKAKGEADLLLFCEESWKLGILDASSFADQELLLRQRYFGKAADKIPAGEMLSLRDREAILLSPEINRHDLRIAAVPYDRGTLVVWGVGEPGSGEALTSAIRSTTMGLEFSGPEGGASVHEVGEWIVHTLTYNPFHPAVLGSGLLFLAVFGGFGWVLLRRPQHTEG